MHHGGSGTILGALAAGVPQLLLPKGADQFENADLMTAAASLRHSSRRPPPRQPSPTLPGTSIGRLSPAAQAVRAELAAMPEPHVVVERLVERFGRGRRSSAA